MVVLMVGSGVDLMVVLTVDLELIPWLVLWLTRVDPMAVQAMVDLGLIPWLVLWWDLGLIPWLMI